MAKIQVRYIVNDMDSSIDFYTEKLGFKLDMHPSPAFAMLSLNELRLALSTPGRTSGGGQMMPDGTQQTPGGWNRFAIEVADISNKVETLKNAGVHFRNNIVTGVGGKQIIADDPSGNPIELFEPILSEARLDFASKES
jgi:catechol 2,3-dioxygenase-like lactoylglutathione lyase family enzyme